MLFSSLGIRPPTAQRRRRFRIIVGILAVAVASLIALQYTPLRLLPERKTTTLWGVLVGMLTMTVVAEWRWTVVTHRDPAG